MGQEIDGEVLGEVYKGYIFKLSGGNDKDGFPMKQGIMINGRTRMMFSSGRKFSLSLLNNNNKTNRISQVLQLTSPGEPVNASADQFADASTARTSL